MINIVSLDPVLLVLGKFGGSIWSNRSAPKKRVPFPQWCFLNWPYIISPLPSPWIRLLIAHRSFQQLWHHVPPTESTHVSLSLNEALMSQPLSFVPACPPIRGLDPCISSNDDITSALIKARAAKVKALMGSYGPSISPYHSITPLCWWSFRAYVDSNEMAHFVFCQCCSNITHTEQTI